MIRDIKKIFRIGFGITLVTAFFASCESEADQLGMQFFQNGTAQGIELNRDVIAYNVNNNDSIEADNDKLINATLGAFDEPNFGMQKSSYVTQMRLSAYNPDFGANAVVDSVVLQLKPFYETATDSIKTTTLDEGFTYDNVAAKKVVTTYPVKKYGKADRSFTINVHEVNDFLNSTETDNFSDKQVATGTILGTKTFDGFVRSIKITKDVDNTELLSRDAALRIPLDKDFFQQKIIDKKGSFELKDAASFIRYIKGIKISVVENDGYIFNFTPNDISAIIYYKYDKTENNATTRTNSSFVLDLGASNVKFNQINYNRSSAYNTAINAINPTTGDAKLYLQGMGGPNTEVKIPDATIAELRDLFTTQKIGIISAKIRLYSDASTWDNAYVKPNDLLVQQKDVNAFLDDLSIFGGSAAYRLVRTVDLDKNPAYYEITITKTLRDIVENLEENKPIVLKVGSYLTASNGALLSQDFNSRAYTPNRVVLVGSDATNAKKAQLKVIYSKK